MHFPPTIQKTAGGKGCSVKALQSGELAGLTSWLSLAVIACGDGRWRTKVNLGERPRTTSHGFEDRGAGVRSRPSTSAEVRLLKAEVHDCSPSSAVIRGLGCLLGCLRLGPGLPSRATTGDAFVISGSGTHSRVRRTSSNASDSKNLMPSVTHISTSSFFANTGSTSKQQSDRRRGCGRPQPCYKTTVEPSAIAASSTISGELTHRA